MTTRYPSPAGDVTGFGPFNEGVQSAIEEVLRQTRLTLVPEITRQIQQQIVPQFTRNTAMQDRIGQATGQAITTALKPYVFVGLASLVVIAGASVWIATKN